MTGASLENRSELSVGRVMFPLAWQINEKLSLGGGVDFVWAGLDLEMAMNAAQFSELAIGNAGSLSGSMLGALPPAVFANLEYAYYRFDNGNDFTGEATGYGYAGKIGLRYAFRDRFAVGATYHSKTRLNDLNTDDATVLISVAGTGMIPIDGEITVKGFQWPATWALGVQFQATSKLMFAADVKRLLWEDVMFRLPLQRRAVDGLFRGQGAAGRVHQPRQRHDHSTGRIASFATEFPVHLQFPVLIGRIVTGGGPLSRPAGRC
jgi:long-chain fatty acid transport protein